MANERLILCGGVERTTREAAWRRAPVTRLGLGDGPGLVRLRVEHLARRAQAPVPDVEADLLEVAAYVFAADQAVTRGGPVRIDYGAAWRRRFRLEVPVRRPDVWRRPAVLDRLARTLEFLTGDEFEFGFVPHPDPAPLDAYLFPGGAEDRSDFDEVVLFSGGLDSLGGGVQEVLAGHRRVALVSHRPENRVFARQQALVEEIRRRAPGRCPRPLHVPVEVNLGDGLVRDFHQRSRSFLYASVAAVTARLFGLRRIRFYENGVTSLNLPTSDQLVGTQASRTTHPRVLLGFEYLFGLLFDGPFGVENPFQWRTKAEVLRGLAAAGHADLCRLTCSCAHVRNRPREAPHCGGCSQCLDRRVAVLAAGLTDAADPPDRYGADVLAAPREGADRLLFERYLGFARAVGRMTTDREFFDEYPEAQAQLGHFRLSPAAAAAEVFRLHRQHAADVLAGLTAAAGGRLEDVFAGRFHPTSLVGMSCVQTWDGRTAPAAAPGTNGQARPAGQPYADGSALSLVCGARSCPLGPTVEYRVAQYLSERFDRWVTVDELKLRVWDDQHTSNNAVQRAISDLRRCLRCEGIADIRVEGRRGHYRMARVDPPRISEESASPQPCVRAG
jgi:hypothetical protein